MHRLRPRLAALRRCRRAAVAIYVALLAPVLAGSIALGIEVSSWSGVQTDMQRAADASAVAAGNYCSAAGANNCGSGGTANSTAQTLAQNLAKANGASNATATLQQNAGVKSASDTTILVSVQKTVPLTISRIFDSSPSVTVSATSTGEIESTVKSVPVTSPGGGGQPCMLALNKWTNGTSTTSNTGFIANGSINVYATGCMLVSNSNFNDAGGSSFTVAGIYAVGAIPPGSESPVPTTSGAMLLIPCWGTVNGSSQTANGCSPWPTNGYLQSNSAVYQKQSPLPDPYASDTALQTALSTISNSSSGSSASGGTAITCNGAIGGACSGLTNGSTCTETMSGGSVKSISCTLEPGNYGGISITNGAPYTFTAAAGTYAFSGPIVVSSGNGATFNLQPGTYAGLQVAGGNPVVFNLAAGTSQNSYLFTGNLSVSGSAATFNLQPGTYAGLSVTGGGPNVFNFAAGTSQSSYVFTGTISVTGSTNTFYMQPGQYGPLSVTGGGPNEFCMAPGQYSFNGNVTLTNDTFTVDRSMTAGGQTITCPSGDTGGVTVLTNGKFTGSNTFVYDITAPNASQAQSSGGIAGVVLAGLGSDTGTVGGSGFTPVVNLSGSVNFQVTGVTYFPNGTFASQGSNGLGASTTSCFELIAGNIVVSGNTYLNSSCGSLNALAFESTPSTTTYKTVTTYSTALVQ